jgi:alkanesulfonate monooxygenase SsuD/methylene tetrahydromethanopterin reductase-like flavin-dependent oxidoreductase (luciferase family)
MFRLLAKSFTSTAKAVLILAGAGFGLIRGLRLLDGLKDNSEAVRAVEERLDAIQAQIQALQDTDERLRTRLESAVTTSVTRDDLAAALDKSFARVQREVDARFADEARSLEALRAMVGQTDELLERLLDRLETMRSEAELQHIGP